MFAVDAHELFWLDLELVTESSGSTLRLSDFRKLSIAEATGLLPEFRDTARDLISERAEILRGGHFEDVVLIAVSEISRLALGVIPRENVCDPSVTRSINDVIM